MKHEQKILEIFRKHGIVCDNAEMNVIKEIASVTYPRGFVEWKDFNTMTGRITKTKMQYMVSSFDYPAVWMSLDELFEFWQDLPENNHQ